MNGSRQNSVIRAALWQRYAWVSLGLLLLFNPFVALSSHVARGLEVCHPASYRATVGASELQHFSPATGWDGLKTAEIAAIAILQIVPETNSEVPLIASSAPLIPQQFIGPGLWFRPPPAR